MRVSFFRNKIFLFIVAAVALFSLSLFQREIRESIAAAAAPFQEQTWKAGNSISAFFSGIFSGARLHEENERMQMENSSLRQHVIELESMQEENTELRDALGLEIHSKFRITEVSLIGKYVFEDVVMINKGKNVGIEEGMPLITPGKVVIGKVIEALQNTSKVQLLSHPQSSVDVRIAGTNTAGIVKGKGQGKLLLDFIPQDQNLSQGDTLVTAELGGVFPQDLFVGTVKEIIRIDAKPFQQAEVGALYELSGLDTLFVITEE